VSNADTNWHGFIPNCWDTKVMSQYVDENFSSGLKQNSERYLGYDQVSYAEVTTMRGLKDDLPKGGRVLKVEEEEGHKIYTKQYRMNELPASHVMAYGCDDTICTAALFNFYSIQMELEQTIDVYENVEIKPAYLTAKAFLDGCKISVERLKQIQEEDDKAFEEQRDILAKTLLEEGLIDQMWEPYTESRCADFKAAFLELYGIKIESKVRTHSKLADQMVADGDIDKTAAVMNFIDALRREDIGYVNQLLQEKYRNDPVLDMNSPKQMTRFMYDVLKLPVRIVNRPTDLERKEKPDMAEALNKYFKAAMKGEEVEWSDEQKAHIRSKAKADDVAVDMALLYDCETHPVAKTVLTAVKEMKTIITRRSLYYNKYPNQVHWMDGLVHASINQCATVTLRYSSSGPNLQQLPKKGEGVKVRQMIVPHHKDAVIVSLDFKGQELILAAEQSGDENMIACYVGDNKKDIHSITASGAMLDRWGRKKVAELIDQINWTRGYATPEDKYDLFVALHKGTDEASPIHKLAEDLRKNSKNVNFLAQYDGQALTLSYQLLMPVHVCQQFLDAREAMFPRVGQWKESVRQRVMNSGYAKTMLGARRHLTKLMFDRATANKASRQGPNFEIQGSAAEQTKLAMGRVWDSNVCYDYDCRFIAPIHDELVFSIHRDHCVDAIRIISRCMTAQYATMKIPAVASISLGPNFGIQIECGDEFNEANIVKALKKVFDETKLEIAA
jgi:hypothetical protein